MTREPETEECALTEAEMWEGYIKALRTSGASSNWRERIETAYWARRNAPDFHDGRPPETREPFPGVRY